MRDKELTQRQNTWWKTLVSGVVISLLGLTFATAHILVESSTQNQVQEDTIKETNRLRELPQTLHMTASLYPVMIKSQGRTVMIRSDHAQLLPVYTGNGSFYMMWRLSKGVNWLNGLPRGRYFINNRPITVN